MNKTLTAKQLYAAVLIGSGENKKTVAEKLQVTPQTISEWMHNPSFEAQINKSKRNLVLNAQDKLRESIMPAVDTLLALMRDAENDNVRFQAARLIIEKSNIAPDKLGLWDAGPTTAIKVLQERQKDGGRELDYFLKDL